MKSCKVICDVCKVECTNDYRTFETVTGKESDPSGNGYQVVAKHTDLCGNCIERLVNYAWTKGSPLVATTP